MSLQPQPLTRRDVSILSHSLSLSFAQTWQQVAEDHAQRAHALLRQEGIAFFDANIAHRWRMLRKDLGYFQVIGDESTATQIRIEMDMLVQDDEAAERQNARLVLDTLAPRRDSWEGVAA